MTLDSSNALITGVGTYEFNIPILENNIPKNKYFSAISGAYLTDKQKYGLIEDAIVPIDDKECLNDIESNLFFGLYREYIVNGDIVDCRDINLNDLNLVSDNLDNFEDDYVKITRLNNELPLNTHSIVYKTTGGGVGTGIWGDYRLYNISDNKYYMINVNNPAYDNYYFEVR